MAAQQDASLRQITEQVKSLRKGTVKAREQVVTQMTSAEHPRVTLMDELSRHNNEYQGANAYKFRLNQVVANVYSKQRVPLTSRGDFFNSTEEGVFYSAIEKNVKRGTTVTYTLTGHAGKQEFVFVSYNPSTTFAVKVMVGNQVKCQETATGSVAAVVGMVKKTDRITLSVTYPAVGKNTAAFESFAILNHNPQK